jgi:hypothetical protein
MIDATALVVAKDQEGTHLRSHSTPQKSSEPAMLGVIVGTGYGYVRDDVAVIPIGALAP